MCFSTNDRCWAAPRCGAFTTCDWVAKATGAAAATAAVARIWAEFRRDRIPRESKPSSFYATKVAGPRRLFEGLRKGRRARAPKHGSGRAPTRGGDVARMLVRVVLAAQAAARWITSRRWSCCRSPRASRRWGGEPRTRSRGGGGAEPLVPLIRPGARPRVGSRRRSPPASRSMSRRTPSHGRDADPARWASRIRVRAFELRAAQLAVQARM